MRNDPIYITWLNYLGGFEYWLFTGKHDHQVDILNSGETTENIFPTWPNSYGSFADTITKQTYVQAKKSIVLRSQHLTKNQALSLSYIKTSPLVQIVYSRADRRTVLVDKNSFMVYSELDKMHKVAFTISYTDDIPSQHI